MYIKAAFSQTSVFCNRITMETVKYMYSKLKVYIVIIYVYMLLKEVVC